MELDVSLGFVHPATAFPFEAAVTLPPQNLGGETVAFDGVTLQGVYQVAGDVVVLEGRLATVAHAACARCAAPAQAVVETAFRETFRKDANEMQDESFRYEGWLLTAAKADPRRVCEVEVRRLPAEQTLAV